MEEIKSRGKVLLDSGVLTSDVPLQLLQETFEKVGDGGDKIFQDSLREARSFIESIPELKNVLTPEIEDKLLTRYIQFSTTIIMSIFQTSY